MKKKIKIEQLNFIKENFPKFGAKYCSQQLNLKTDRINYIARKILNLGKLDKKIYGRIIRDAKSNYFKLKNKYNVDHQQFINIKCKETAYLLGLIWADGNINEFKNKNKKSVAISLITEDMENLVSIFEKTGNWGRYDRKRIGKKPSTCFTNFNPHLANYLIDNGYKSKSYQSACQIIKNIPDEFKHYWFRGLFDGDGCLYIDKQNRPCLTISSSYEQDWTYLESLFKHLNINYRIIRSKSSVGKSSCINIRNKDGCKCFLDYIYGGYDKDKIGIIRKYQKYIITNFNKKINQYK